MNLLVRFPRMRIIPNKSDSSCENIKNNTFYNSITEFPTRTITCCTYHIVQPNQFHILNTFLVNVTFFLNCYKMAKEMSNMKTSITQSFPLEPELLHKGSTVHGDPACAAQSGLCTDYNCRGLSRVVQCPTYTTMWTHRSLSQIHKMIEINKDRIVK